MDKFIMKTIFVRWVFCSIFQKATSQQKAAFPMDDAPSETTVAASQAMYRLVGETEQEIR